jgi:hypothetical protein
MDFRDVGWESMDWIQMAQDRDPMVGCREHGNEILGSVKGGEFLD